MHYGLIKLLIKTLWECLDIKWSMENIPLELEHKSYWEIKELNCDFKLVGENMLFHISSLDEWRTQAYENAKLFKEKLKDGMTKESKSVSSRLENMFFCTTLISESLQENSSPNGKDPMSSRRCIDPELSK